MNIICKSRGEGKTTDLIRLSARTQIPIVSLSPEYVSSLASSLGLDIPAPLYITDFMKQRPHDIYVDEIPYVFERAFGVKVNACTMSADD